MECNIISCLSFLVAKDKGKLHHHYTLCYCGTLRLATAANYVYFYFGWP